MKELIAERITDALRDLQNEGVLPSFDLPEIEVEFPRNEAFGEYTTNIALVTAKAAGKSPREIAELLAGKITLPGLASVEIAGPGHLNFVFEDAYFHELVSEALSHEGNFAAAKREKVMIEYSQPNTHKEFHIGHLRNVFIGSALVSVMRKSGHDVLGVNYIGDTGSHIAKCLWGLTALHAGENIDGIENKAEFLGRVYSEATRAIEENPENEEAFKSLQNRFDAGDPELVALWEKTRQWSLDEFGRLYDELSVSFDAYFYESVEEEAGKKILPDLLEKDIVTESDGAVIADLEAYGLGVLVLVRRDGSALYGLKDIPLAIKKFREYGIDRSIYVVDVRQALYFKQLFKILELYGFTQRLEHVGYEFVALKGGETMSSRKGNVIPARALIDDVTERVRNQFPESPHPVAIALGAIRFAMLKQSSQAKIEFDIDESVRLDGATGPYVQYAYARIASILRKAEREGFRAQASERSLEAKEKELIREIGKFKGLVLEISETNEVHKLAHYALRLAEKFHSFYNDCQVLDREAKETSEGRLLLVTAVGKVLGETLSLMGVSAPEQM